VVNIYAPSGAEKRQEKEDFFNFDLPYLLHAMPNTVILGGDFNCVLAKADVTGHFNFSRALNTLVKGYNLVDMWTTAPDRGVYAHYTGQGGSQTRQYM
jgi:exonuclease III